MKKEIEEKDIFVVENQECPICFKKKARFSEYEIEDMYCGPISIFAIKCLACGFRKNDLEFLEPKEPAEYILEVKDKKDLTAKVIKSGNCEVTIPELKLSVDSGVASDGYITNVEGVLEKFRQQVDFLKQDNMDNKEVKKLDAISEKIDKAISAELPITLKLKDDSGNSMIIGDNVTVKKLKVKKNKK